ncbi:MAG: hypothetical protein AB1896_23675 [Thermodesulfobacteriota bacterium]
MISSTFINLQSRFGFHFCTVEALVGGRRDENYIRFTFKGGAADINRRQARVDFLARILEDYGFRVELKEDMANARLDGRERDYMLKMLKAVGYLIMHTRQLDMIMAHGPTVAYYRRKIITDLESLTSRKDEGEPPAGGPEDPDGGRFRSP